MVIEMMEVLDVKLFRLKMISALVTILSSQWWSGIQNCSWPFKQ